MASSQPRMVAAAFRTAGGSSPSLGTVPAARVKYHSSSARAVSSARRIRSRSVGFDCLMDTLRWDLKGLGVALDALPAPLPRSSSERLLLRRGCCLRAQNEDSPEPCLKR